MKRAKGGRNIVCFARVSDEEAEQLEAAICQTLGVERLPLTRVPAEQAAKLRELATTEVRSVQCLIREAISQYLATK